MAGNRFSGALLAGQTTALNASPVVGAERLKNPGEKQTAKTC
jgi:hypothetical protein